LRVRPGGAAVEDGALGLSTGLIYAPGMYAATGEVTALAEAAHAAGLNVVGWYLPSFAQPGEPLA